MSQRRLEKIDGEIQRIIGEVFIRDIKDPRFSKMTGVTRVSTTPDLKYAKVYVNVYDNDEKVRDTLDALRSAEPFIRSRINEKLKLRRIPYLDFVLDRSIEYSIEMSKKIDEILAKDRENARNSEESETTE